MVNSRGNVGFDGRIYSVMYFQVVLIPSLRSISEYIDRASDVNIFEPGGNGPAFCSFLMKS